MNQRSMQVPRKKIVCWMSGIFFMLFIVVADCFRPIPFRASSSLLSVERISSSQLWSTTQIPPPPGEETPSPALPKPDAYKVLGLSRDATVDKVKSRYRKLAKLYHPDANPEDERNKTTVLFQTIQEAYEVAIARARYRRDLQKKKDEAIKNQEEQPFVRLGIDTVDTSMYSSPTTTDYDQGVHAPSSPTEAERDLRARATGSYQSSPQRNSRPPQHRAKQPSYNSNSPHHPRTASTPSDSDWDAQPSSRNNNPSMSTPYTAARRRQTPYNPNPYRRKASYQPYNTQQPQKGYVPHSVATPQPKGPSWGRPRPFQTNRVVRDNGVDGSNWNIHNPYAGGSAPSSRPRPQRRKTNFVQPNFVNKAPGSRRNVFAKRRPPHRPYQPPASGWWGETTNTSTGMYTPQDDRPQPFVNEDYFTNGQNDHRRLHNYNNEEYLDE